MYEYFVFIVPDGLEYDGSGRRPYYRMCGKPVIEEQDFELIRRNHYPQGCGWIHTDGTIGDNSITQTYPELYFVNMADYVAGFDSYEEAMHSLGYHDDVESSDVGVVMDYRIVGI